MVSMYVCENQMAMQIQLYDANIFDVFVSVQDCVAHARCMSMHKYEGCIKHAFVLSWLWQKTNWTLLSLPLISRNVKEQEVERSSGTKTTRNCLCIQVCPARVTVLQHWPACTWCHVWWVSSSSTLLSMSCLCSSCCCWLCVHICVCLCRFKARQMSYQEQTTIHWDPGQIPSNLPVALSHTYMILFTRHFFLSSVRQVM